MPKQPMKDLIPNRGPRGSFIRKGYLTQTFIGPEMGERIYTVIKRENVTTSDFIRIAVTRLLEEYEEEGS